MSGKAPQSQTPLREVIHQGWTTYGIATITERDGTRVRRAFEDHGAAVCVLPYDPARRVALLVRQMRVGPVLVGEDGEVAEVPAGGIEEGEDPAAAALREVLEEAGLRLLSLDPVARPYTMPSISTERLHLYLAVYGESDRVAAGGGVAIEGEQLVVEEVPLTALAADARAGTLRDLKTLVLVLALQLRQPELFAAEHEGGAI